ncbi:biliverdin-producing heme oxygenase [Sphingomonas solaris]|uniref:Biliverdin-producing heme oxygenase n=1 Tax=Alterirhizorhabdus solaris TaxID=2529389 RepID=A0A558QXI7_9SPHN|nr:biliverdin-producing heme oxygenase [Sphingomonas solaris]TVV71873.1 biliverdin-producing heme oxygenase [Sphingomonas solaris]
MSLRADLRGATADDHNRLDAVFGQYDLADAAAYRRFLRAHARALQPVETAIAGSAATHAWQPRVPLIAADLAALGEPMPEAMTIDPPGAARLWGMRYVVEGSRLGGAMLARQVGAGLPAAYLGAQHGKGEWRGFLEALEGAGDAGGAEWRAEAGGGAQAAFALFAASAAQEATDGPR